MCIKVLKIVLNNLDEIFCSDIATERGGLGRGFSVDAGVAGVSGGCCEIVTLYRFRYEALIKSYINRLKTIACNDYVMLYRSYEGCAHLEGRTYARRSWLASEWPRFAGKPAPTKRLARW
ncbi:hypothetical protein [Pseudomonas sp. OTU5201]|uniref:hypothetical protein n=1 Tax=Pseudomonas sp. OTU5201 TaxID=3043850 RepID=UPI00313D1C67